MANIILPRKWKNQPNYCTKLRENSDLAQGLVIALNLGAGVQDAVSGLYWINTALIPNVSRKGNGYKATNSSTGNLVSPIAYNLARLPGVPPDILSVSWGLGNIVLSNWRQMWGTDNSQADASLVHLDGAGKMQVKFGGAANFSTADGVLTNGDYCDLSLVIKSTRGCELIKNGNTTLYSTAANSYPTNASAILHVFGSGANTRRLDSQIPYWYVHNRVLAREEVAEIARNPWQIFKRDPQILYFDVGSGIGSTGTISCILENYISSIVGTTTIVGSITNTLANHTSVITGTPSISGTLSSILDDNNSNISGTILITGTLSKTLDDFTSSISGALGQNVSGTISVTTEDNTSTITGSTAVTGTITVTVTLADATLDGTTTVLGTITQQMENFTSSIYGFTGAVGIQARLRTLLGMGT